MTIRLVTAHDIPLLSEFWYDQMALRSQKQSAIKLAPDAIKQWRQFALSCLDDDTVAFYLVEINDDVLGCAIGRVQANQVGLLPKQVGIIEHVILDLHSPHKRKNAVNQLLEGLKDYFRQSDIQHIIVQVPTQSPVEQAFWRGFGVLHLNDIFWMDLE